MDPIVVILLVGLAIIALVMVYTRTYLNIIAEDNRCVDAWKVVEKDMARRGDLVLGLEATMAERVGRGSDAIEPISAARVAVEVAEKPEEKAAASDALTEELRAMFSMAERSTVLMTNPDLVQLLTDIADAENSLARSRESYEKCVRGYNSRVTSFPGNKISGYRYRPRKSLTAKARHEREHELPWARF